MALILRWSLLPCVLLGLAATGSPAATTEDSVATVAESSLERFLSRIPPGQEESYGFRNRDELARASVGNPIRMFGTRPSLGDSFPERKDSSWNRPLPLEVWRIPVLVHRQSRALLTVERVGGVLKTVDLGGAGLAREIGEFDSTHAGKRRGLMRVESMRCDLILLDRTGQGFDQAELHPLRSARPFFEADSGASGSSRNKVFETIHRRVHERSESSR